jgi:hypothetical protein
VVGEEFSFQRPIQIVEHVPAGLYTAIIRIPKVTEGKPFEEGLRSSADRTVRMLLQFDTAGGLLHDRRLTFETIIPHHTIFPWPPQDQPLAVLLRLENSVLNGSPSSRIVSMECADSLVQLS